MTALRWLRLPLLLLVAWPARAAPPILKLSELQPGMKGEGRTVLRGTEIERFGFEVLDILESDGFTPDLILVRLTGRAIERFGGIAAGMSGSPLFVEDKLIGAVAFTTPFSDTRVGYATPIEDMLKVFDLAREAPEPLGALPAGTPILACGLRGHALAAATRVLGRDGRRVIPVAGPRTADEPPARPADGLKEGSAVAVSLTAGDVAMTALGTLTWRDGDRFVAFGHPFRRRGDTSLFLQEAYIYDVVQSVDLPFKIGAPLGDPVGTVTQDRSAGLGGVLGRTADSFKLTVEAADELLGRTRTLNVDVVRDGQVAPSLAAVCLIQAVDEVRDVDGGGTAAVAWSIEADGLRQPLRRDDLHFSPDDLLGEVAAGPILCLDALLRNDFAPVRPTRVTVRVTVSPERRVARLVEAVVEPRAVRPGETCRVTVSLQPFRGPLAQRELTLAVPADQPPGRLVIDLHGRLSAPGPLNQAALTAAGLNPPRSLDELTALLAGAQRGNALTCELLTPEAAAARQEARALLRDQPGLEALLGDEPTTLPSPLLELGAQPTLAVARAETILPQVVTGRLIRSLEVLAP